MNFILPRDFLYGSLSLDSISPWSLYGKAFQYADKAFNAGGYTGNIDQDITDPNALAKYFDAISNGADLLSFTFYVPVGWGRLDNNQIPNVEETADPQKIFTVHFNGEQEVW